MSDHVEYETSAEEYWRINRWDELSARFGLDPADLRRWHDTLAGFGRVWQILRLRYQIAPVVGESNPDYFDSWDEDAISHHLGLAVAVVSAEIDAAVTKWGQSGNEAALMTDFTRAVGEGEIEQLTQFASLNSLSAAAVASLLEAYSFIVADEHERMRVAHRILDLKAFLIAPNTREIAREIIRVEMSMRMQNLLLAGYSNKLKEKLERDPTMISTGSEITDLNQKMMACDGALKNLSTAHGNLMKSIGADDLDMSARKRIFVETVNHLLVECQRFESDPGNQPIDGVFTAAEVEWLQTPLGERGNQYRPDVVVRIREALLPENLWDPGYKPTPIEAGVLARLRKLSDQMSEELVNGEEGFELVVPDEDPSDDDADADPLAARRAGGTGAPALDGLDDLPATSYRREAAPAESAPIIGIF